jgi:hypothetical protein
MRFDCLFSDFILFFLCFHFALFLHYLCLFCLILVLKFRFDAVELVAKFVSQSATVSISVCQQPQSVC